MEERGVHFELGRRVVDARPGQVVLDNREIPARTLVWTAGTVPNPLMREAGLEIDKRGAALVDKTLAIAGRERLWALGDCAAVVDGKTNQPCPPTAQFALREGRVLAKNIKALPFRFARGLMCRRTSHGLRGVEFAVAHPQVSALFRPIGLADVARYLRFETSGIRA
jgi:pyruvate/2-oxoglutarate dehydrogenase complex dihydrolipoamide dehydrogenase (E3) component